MDTKTRQLLIRWISLRSGTGLARAKSIARFLGIAGFLLFVVLVIGLTYDVSALALVVVSGVMGWIVAERNALTTRIAQWPTFATYVEWERVTNALDGK